MTSSNMPLLNLILLIDVTFSTPTVDYTASVFLVDVFRVNERNHDVTPVDGPAPLMGSAAVVVGSHLEA